MRMRAAQLDTDRAQGWKGVLQRAIETYKFNNDWNNKEVQQGRASKYSGLVADFYVYDTSSREYYPAKGKVREKDQDKDYNYNACRSVHNGAVLLFCVEYHIRE